MPSAAYRFFHAITVGLDSPVRFTISFVPTPSAASSTIRARCASPAGIDGARSHRASSARSDSGNSTTAFNGIAKPTAKLSYFIHATLGAELDLATTVIYERDWPVLGSVTVKISRNGVVLDVPGWHLHCLPDTGPGQLVLERAGRRMGPIHDWV